MKPEKTDNCETCNRIIDLSFHHLVPKKMHDKPIVRVLHLDKDLDHYGVWVCLDCHKKIHRLFTHQQLASEYYSLELLRKDEAFQKFLRWVRKQKKRVK